MTRSNYPTVALVGPGAIGATVAAALHEAGRMPVICGRSAHERPPAMVPASSKEVGIRPDR